MNKELNVMLDPWIETYTGKKFYFLSPHPAMIEIEDIAHALSQTCRFSGHTREFYSVAQHCINVSDLLMHKYHDPELALEGLFHDSAEAYLTDIATPVKKHLPEYEVMEDRILRAIHRKYNIHESTTDRVKDADTCMLLSEAKAFLPSEGKDWAQKYMTTFPLKENLRGWSPEVARFEYKILFQTLVTAVARQERAAKMVA